MLFSYNKLWKILIDKNMNRKKLMELTQITGTTMAKMSKGRPVSMEVLGRICKALDVNIGDLVDYVSDEMDGDR
ncbi:DNA-binding transcriptional regulator, XRE family [Butyrivibrio sp. INlla18]|uniref:helix-turn-helix domain-containing protein n=1 Tax=Butyrivibrio sp. INlla18 TaxID=1520806 RepID=UPI000881B45E|nr:helix-turn-helix transcriptional regulator [Butyrivibrio sp. INlla18]SDA39023.1 DNA-binding transcriptional regulator, XRE family [Butyrivibrio sp. INlla18]